MAMSTAKAKKMDAKLDKQLGDDKPKGKGKKPNPFAKKAKKG